MTNRALSIYGLIFKSFWESNLATVLKLDVKHLVLKCYLSYSSNDLGLTLTFLWHGQTWENASYVAIVHFDSEMQSNFTA